MDIQNETKVIFYKSQKEMDKGITSMQNDGWEVVHTEVVKGDHTFFKTCCLGCLFLPLALLGKSKDTYKVQFRRKLIK